MVHVITPTIKIYTTLTDIRNSRCYANTKKNNKNLSIKDSPYSPLPPWPSTAPPEVILSELPLALDCSNTTLPSANRERRGVSPARVGCGRGCTWGCGRGCAWGSLETGWGAACGGTDSVQLHGVKSVRAIYWMNCLNIHRTVQTRSIVRAGQCRLHGGPWHTHLAESPHVGFGVRQTPEIHIPHLVTYRDQV